MTARLNQALRLAERGFWVFPCEEGGKVPAVKDWPNRATRDADQIRQWWSGRAYNIGISTSRFADDKALCVVDVDTKNGKDGNETIFALEMEGFDLPVSLEQATPSGGRHIVYLADVPLKQGVNVLGPGLDIRSGGGYIVGPGSEIDGRLYAQINGHGKLAQAPGWLVDRLGNARSVDRHPAAVIGDVDPDRAARRAMDWLAQLEPATSGGRNHAAFKAAAQLKDFGCDEFDTFALMTEHWKCEPMIDDAELEHCVRSAFTYGKEPVGSAAPEAIFPKAERIEDAPADPGHPVYGLNDNYAFVQTGGHVIHETTDAKGRFKLDHMSLGEFHSWFANKKIPIGEKQRPVSEVWMGWDGRREYQGFVFAPGREVDPRFYNLWHGFSVEPAEKADHPMLDRFLEHALENVCNGDRDLFHWLIGYFAHLVQRPWEKPLVALVFKGKKGTGKNALIERVCHLLGHHAMVTAKRRYLTGNFNSHFENCLLFVGDELYWAGDKQAEGELKDLITGTEHVIEHKNQTPYTVDNLTRVAIIGNEAWLVPATADERRFAVFEVGEGRMQQRKYFEELRLGLDEEGGDAHLLRYLLDFDLAGIDLNAAPDTRGLALQKAESLIGVDLFWYECADTAEAGGRPWLEDGVRVQRHTLYAAYERLHKGNRNKYPHKSDKAFWKDTFALFTQIANTDTRLDGARAIDLIGLSEARTWLVGKLKVLNEWTEGTR